MSFTYIPVALWMLVPTEERQRLIKVFELERTGPAEIRDEFVISDGYSKDDLAKITAERMTVYVGSEESFPRLWELTVAKARSEIHPPVGVIVNDNGIAAIDTPPEQLITNPHAKTNKKK